MAILQNKMARFTRIVRAVESAKTTPPLPEAQNRICPDPVLAAPPLRVALSFALIAAATAAFVSVMSHQREGIGTWSDFSPLLLGAQALRQGLNPYATVALEPLSQPLGYPLPAVLLAVPWSWLSMSSASAGFSALGVGVLAYAHARTGPIERPAVVAFCSAAVVKTVMYSQWPALLLGAVLLSNGPWAGALLACKPTTAIWLWALRPSWKLIAGALVAYAISLAVRPTWPMEWWAVLIRLPSPVIPAMLPGGFLIVIATALRWRRPEARLLLAMCCVPHTTLFYETLPLLMLVPTTWTEAWLLCACSWISYLTFSAYVFGHPTSVAHSIYVGGLWSLGFLYAPCAILLLLRKDEDSHVDIR